MTDGSKAAADAVRKKIGWLLHSCGEADRKMILAQLRRGLGKAPGELPEIWEITLGDLPEEAYSKNGKPTNIEWAVYTALTVFAVHQQGHDTASEPMHKENISLGKAVRMLVKDPDDEERVRRRLNQIVTAVSPQEYAAHLRRMVQLLEREGIPLDYVRLAADLYWLSYPESRKKVQLRIGQDFYRYNTNKETKTQEN